MNNFNKIKAMNIDEIAEFIMCQNMCFKCVNKELPICKEKQNCKSGIKQWLEQEIEEEQ